MRKSTIKLTKHELNFACDTTYPLVKQQIVHKVGQLLNQLGQTLALTFGNHSLIGVAGHKVSRGENYRNMPYLVLDFPKINGKNFPIVCRTLFWWGHYFSCTVMVHTSLIDISQTASMLAQQPKLRLGIGDDLWEQDIQSQGFEKLSGLSAKKVKQYLEQADYLKVVSKIAIKDTDTLETKATRMYTEILSRISIKKGA